MRTISALVLSTALLAGGEARTIPAPAPEPIADAVIERPAGAYAAVRLEFTVADAPHPSYAAWMCWAPLRDGRVTIDHHVGVSRPGGVLMVEGDRLHGTFRRKHEKRKDGTGAPGEVEVTVDARIADGAITGTCSLSGRAGTVAGVVVSDDALRRDNAIPATAAWPAWLGPAGTGLSAMPGQFTVRASLAGMQPLWRSELPLPQGQGSVSRKTNEKVGQSGSASDVLRISGGGWCPVAADGSVFVAYYQGDPGSDDAPQPANLAAQPWWVREKFAPADEYGGSRCRPRNR